MLYVYENHLGGYFTTKRELDYDLLHCITCGGNDWLIGMAKNEEEAEEMYEKHILLHL